MSLMHKILLAAAAPLLAGGVLIALAYGQSARTVSVGQSVEKARGILLTVEATRAEMGDKWSKGVFTTAQLQSWAATGDTDKILAAVPVVTAWRAAQVNAAAGGYEFRVTKRQPRNPKNEPDAVEARVLAMFDADPTLTQHHEFDAGRNAVRYFRPIRLTAECLLCHGDPADSPRLWGNSRGLDPTGGRMENWKAGELHGVFEIIQSQDAADAQRASTIRLFGMLIAGILAVGLCGLWYQTRRNIVRPLAAEFELLAAGSREVAAAAHQLSESSQVLSRSASEQAASLQETSASMAMVGNVTRENVRRSSDANDFIMAVDNRVGDSETQLQAMVSSMQAIDAAGQQVGKIIKTIDEIAFQTNILALNAAVEAARAGEAGMGFAVVADEVRTLAQRSAQAAKETTAMIETSLSRTADGGTQVTRAAQAVAGITTSVHEVRSLIENVTAAGTEQSHGIAQVSDAIVRLERVTQAVAATSEENAAASQELTAQADVTMAVLRRVDQLINGRSAVVPPPAAATAPVTPRRAA